MDNTDEAAAVLAANDAFYQAFRERDAALMDDIWASGEPVFCIHPGWVPLVGRESVLDSFGAIMSQPSSPAVRSEGARVRVDGAHATVVCFEAIGQARLVATNLFVRLADGTWRIYHHHAGPTQTPAPGALH